jgi:hypothetical protein
VSPPSAEASAVSTPAPQWAGGRTPSLPDAFRSVAIPAGAQLWRKIGAFAGPGFLVAVGYIDPGNWATDIAGGSKYGYALLPAIAVSNLLAIFLQALALRLGIATGRDLAQLCRERFNRPAAYSLWVACEFAIIATDLAEVIGSAIGPAIRLGNRRGRAHAHVDFLRAALGSAAVAEPTIDLVNSFNILAQAAGLGQTFNPFASETNFLIGAFVFEDVGVTAYHGAARYIQDKDYLDAAAGILAVEAYHASNIRTVMYERGLTIPAQLISNLRNTLGGAGTDQGIVLNGKANIIPANKNGIAFERTPEEVLNIVYAGGAPNDFGFFPNRVNGAIR